MAPGLLPPQRQARQCVVLVEVDEPVHLLGADVVSGLLPHLCQAHQQLSVVSGGLPDELLLRLRTERGSIGEVFLDAQFLGQALDRLSIELSQHGDQFRAEAVNQAGGQFCACCLDIARRCYGYGDREEPATG